MQTEYVTSYCVNVTLTTNPAAESKAMASQRITYNKDVDTFATRHKRRTENLLTSDFPRKVRLFDDLLTTEQFSMTKLTSLQEDTRAVSYSMNNIASRHGTTVYTNLRTFHSLVKSC